MVEIFGDDILYNASNHQQDALNWLLNNDMFPVRDSDAVLQRYALAVMYYAMGGSYWGDSCQFLDIHESECDWICSNRREGVFCDSQDRVREIILSEFEYAFLLFSSMLNCFLNSYYCM